jgi:hypothetical protein
MPRSSESIAALASALAKAQAELINPDKSLTATVRSGRPGEGARSFRYAPLASGLDIVRKTLGQHEIATLQTTAIDQTAAMVNLTTTLAHASGEWIASDWPVCPIAETANPQRMGAALTYARRYALFTLVGIAGEDDLDAPDLCDGHLSPSRSTHERWINPSNGKTAPASTRKWTFPPWHEERAPVILNADASAELREKLVGEIGDIASAKLATKWARRALAAKNSLASADAKIVENAFERRLSEFSPSDTAAPSNNDASRNEVAEPEQTIAIASDQPKGLGKSILPIAAPRRYRNKEHLRYVAQQPCLVCGRNPSDPHHLRFVQPRALGRKASDEFVVPLCRVHHREVHRAGDERAWWRQIRIDPLKVARKLWRHTRGNEGRIRPRRAPQGAAPDPSSESGALPMDSQASA